MPRAAKCDDLAGQHARMNVGAVLAQATEEGNDAKNHGTEGQA
jgi:hypothetical protein